MDEGRWRTGGVFDGCCQDKVVMWNWFSFGQCSLFGLFSSTFQSCCFRISHMDCSDSLCYPLALLSTPISLSALFETLIYLSAVYLWLENDTLIPWEQVEVWVMVGLDLYFLCFNQCDEKGDCGMLSKRHKLWSIGLICFFITCFKEQRGAG